MDLESTSVSIPQRRSPTEVKEAKPPAGQKVEHENGLEPSPDCLEGSDTTIMLLMLGACRRSRTDGLDVGNVSLYLLSYTCNLVLETGFEPVT